MPSVRFRLAIRDPASFCWRGRRNPRSRWSLPGDAAHASAASPRRPAENSLVWQALLHGVEYAQAEASAAREDVQMTQLMLSEAAQLAFFDYYLVRRQQDLNVAT